MAEMNGKESADSEQLNIKEFLSGLRFSRTVWNVLKTVLAGAGVYFVLQYLFPYVSPFLFSFCIVYLLDPWLEKMQKKTHIRREVLLVGVLAFAVTGILLILWLCFQGGTMQAAKLAENWEGVSMKVSGRIRIFFGDCCVFIEDHLGIDADKVEQVILERMDVLVEEVRVELLPKLMTESWWYARKLLSVAAFLGITFVASLLLCKDFKVLMGYMQRRSGEPWLPVLDRVLHLAVVFLKTQGIIMLTVAGVASAGLLLGKVNSAVILGILAGILDALPFIGTGIVLIPTALWQLISGRYGAAVWCIAVYMICIAVRELLEPRLMGEKTGIYPIFMLLSVYAGVKLFGISGILKGPLGLVVLTEICRKRSSSE